MLWQRWAVCLMCLLLAGCTVLPTVPALPTPVRPPALESTSDALQAVLSGDYPPDALIIQYQAGNEHWQGRTTLSAWGDGRLAVTFEQGDKHSAWESSLSEDEFLALCRLLVAHNVWTIRGQREHGVPDEAYPTIRVQAEGFEPLQVGMWQGEALEHPDFRAVVNVLAGLASRLSDGIAR